MSQELVAESYFFRSSAVEDNQLAQQAFGPVLGSEETQFRITSVFTSVTETTAYSVCSGQVLLIPSVDPVKINLILKPFRQPINGLPIKYFVYRGLRKTDFIPSGNTDIVAYSNRQTSSEFIQLIWDQLVKFNNEASSLPFNAEWIGYDPARQGSTLIDDLFFLADAFNDGDNEALKPFELPIVPAGISLGSFTGNYGLDIVLSDGDYKATTSVTGFQFDLTYASAEEAIIDTTTIPTGYTEKEYREAISHFVDPAAYYGLHYSDVGKVIVREGENSAIKEKQQIYDDVISKFITKNKVYIHIQGHLRKSYNYYNTYSTVLGNDDVVRIGTSEDTLNPTIFSTNGWPLMIHDESQSHSIEVNTIYMQLVYENDFDPILYGLIGNLGEEAERNFLFGDQLIPFSTIAERDATKLRPDVVPFRLIMPNVTAGTDKNNVSNYIKLIYEGSQLKLSDSEESDVKALDTLFGPVNTNFRIESNITDAIQLNSNHINQLVKTSDIDERAPDNRVDLNLKTIENKIAVEETGGTLNILSTVLYETLFFDGQGEGLFLNSNPQNENTTARTIHFVEEENNTYKITAPNYVVTKEFIDNGTAINGLGIINSTKEYPNKYLLGITKAENESLKSLISTNNFHHTSMFFEQILTEEPIFYKKYRLGLLAEQSGRLDKFFPMEDIFIYSLDNIIYFSKDYSEHIQDDAPLAYGFTIERTL